MSKLPSIVTLTAIVALLAGCSAADEPDARTAATESATQSPAPSPSPSVETTETPSPEETASEGPVESSPAPSPEPPAEPVVEAPAEPAPNLEPLPAGPNDPFVPPPHGEPNPTTPPIVVADDTTPHSDPAYFENVGPIYPQPDGIATGAQIVSQGATLTIAGTGYAPGAEIHVLLAKPQSGYNYLTDNVVYAGPDGSYSFPITIGVTMPVDYYAIMTWTPKQADREASKRFHNIHITSAGS